MAKSTLGSLSLNVIMVIYCNDLLLKERIDLIILHKKRILLELDIFIGSLRKYTVGIILNWFVIYSVLYMFINSLLTENVKKIWI